MTPLCALIIENRSIPDLTDIIADHEKFLPKNTPIYWLNNEPINTMHDYNKLLTSKRLWRNLAENVLIFQHDSELYRTGIEEFIVYDYIGAHIKWMPGYFNGGLSLRNREAMLNVIDKVEWQGQNEDLYFVEGLRQLGGKLPDAETAHKFSVETEYHLGSCGAHAIDKYLTPIQCEQIRNQYL